MLHRPAPDILQRGKRILDHPVPDRELDARGIDRRGIDRHLQPQRLAPEQLQLVGVAEVERHRGGDELDGEIRLQIGRLVGDDGVAGGVGLVEAVAGELRHQVEDVVGLRPVHALLDRAGDEALLLLVHLALDLLAHGAAQQIGLAERIARQHLGDLHHLLLVDDDAIGLLEDRLEHRVQVVGLLVALLAGDEARNVVHRAGAIQRHDGDDVLDAVGLHLAQHVAHAGAFQLEDPDRVAGAEHLVDRRIVIRDAQDVEVDLALAEQLDRLVDDGQRLEPEKVELHQPGRLDPFQIELGRGHVGARVAVERHQFLQRPVADDHAGRMGRGMAVQPLELQPDLEQVAHRLVESRSSFSRGSASMACASVTGLAGLFGMSFDSRSTWP
jgi:hypothetical protein